MADYSAVLIVLEHAMIKRMPLLVALLSLAACSSIPPAAQPGVAAAAAVVAAPILFRIGASRESSDPPKEVGCFEKIENGQRETICPP